jgi:hypothetical protein
VEKMKSCSYTLDDTEGTEKNKMIITTALSVTMCLNLHNNYDSTESCMTLHFLTAQELRQVR